MTKLGFPETPDFKNGYYGELPKVKNKHKTSIKQKSF